MRFKMMSLGACSFRSRHENQNGLLRHSMWSRTKSSASALVDCGESTATAVGSLTEAAVPDDAGGGAVIVLAVLVAAVVEGGFAVEAFDMCMAAMLPLLLLVNRFLRGGLDGVGKSAEALSPSAVKRRLLSACGGGPDMTKGEERRHTQNRGKKDTAHKFRSEQTQIKSRWMSFQSIIQLYVEQNNNNR